jgi:two-component system chemotaxis sensor kinase CheA
MDQETLKRQLLDTFKVELDEHVLTLNKGLLRLEQGASGEKFDSLVTELFRAAHSLKGASRTVDILDINLVAHRLEDVLGLIQHQKIRLSSQLFDLMFQAVDLIKACMRAKLDNKEFPFDKLNAIVQQLEAATVLSDLSQTNNHHKSEKKDLTDFSISVINKKNNKKQNDRNVNKTQNENDDKDNNESQARNKPNGENNQQEIDKKQEQTIQIPFGQSENKEQELTKKPDSKKEEKLVQHVQMASFSDEQISGSDDTIRVKTNKLDLLMASMGELMGSRMRTMQRIIDLQTMQKLINRWYKEWRHLRGSMKSLERKHFENDALDPFFSFMHDNADNLKHIHTEINVLVRHFMNDCDQLVFISDDLQDKIRNVRMQPISSLFDQFPRMIRDLSRNQKKNIRLEIMGEKTEVDRHVLDALKDPLTHILRNSVDHGIEMPQQRQQIGKPEQGLITLKASQKGSTIVIKIIDDGRGIDLDSVREQAVEKNIVPEQKAKSLSNRELTDLIFCSGLSTQTTVTDISGRGVGLDVVRRNLEKLQGQIMVESLPNKGTTIALTVSLSLATSQVLMVKVDGELLAIPCTTVERILKVHSKDIGQIDGKPAIVVDNEALPLFSLAPLLDFSETVPSSEDEKISVVVLSVAEKRLTFRVDELLETREIVIKNMGQQLRRVRNLSGATILGNGQIVMVLNVADLMKSAQHGGAYLRPVDIAPATPERKCILVVDDSITTRTLEKNILENSGYQVLVCADGQEAWDCIQSESFDAVVSDVDMPRMNGFQLAERIRDDERYKTLPFILVTSLESRADKIRGMEVGADAYIVKGTFDQKELLDTIERLIG